MLGFANTKLCRRNLLGGRLVRSTYLWIAVPSFNVRRQWLSSSGSVSQVEKAEKVEEVDTSEQSTENLSRYISPLEPAYSWSIIFHPEKVKTTVNDSLILSSLNIQSTRSNTADIPLVVLLVTPSRVSHLNDDSPFIPKLIRQIFGPSRPQQVIDVVAAVVDKIPVPLRREFTMPDVFNRMSAAECNGGEGISVSVLNANQAAPDLWVQRDMNLGEGDVPNRNHCTLSFVFPCDKSTEKTEFLEGLQSSFTYTSGLRVANTVFSNGQTSTLFATRWESAPRKRHKIGFRRTKKVKLLGQTIDMAGMFHDEDLKNSIINTGLVDITAPRLVADSMGNIVRKLCVGNDVQETVPASKELETVVSRCIEVKKSSNEPITVWALITPCENQISQPLLRVYDTRSLLEQGSRLHKVLGGGGGWGTKEGLLALDPSSSVSDMLDTQEETWNEEELNPEPSKVFGQIVKPGDEIRFLLRKPTRKPTYSRRFSKRTAADSPQPHAWDITFPYSVYLGSYSTPSDMGSGNQQIKENSNADSPYYFFIRNHFGMLSENGIDMRIDTSVPAESVEPHGNVVQTRIDTPQASFSVMRPGGKLISTPNHKDVQRDYVTSPLPTAVGSLASDDLYCYRVWWHCGTFLINQHTGQRLKKQPKEDLPAVLTRKKKRSPNRWESASTFTA